MEIGNTLKSAVKENDHLGILVVNQSGKIQFWNKKFQLVWGIPDRLFESGLDLDLLQFVQQKLRDPDTFQNQVERLYADHSSKSHDILQLKENRFLERYSTPLYNPEGDYTGRIWYFEDVSDRELAKLQLEEGKKRYEELFENMNDAFALHRIIVDEQGNPIDYEFLDANTLFLNRVGMTRDQLLNHRARELFPNTEQHWIDAFAKVAFHGERMQFTNYSAELGRYYLASITSPRKGYFAGIFSDVTDLKRAEDEKEKLIQSLETKNSELERFAYSVSHDLRSPLVTIQGFVSEAMDAIGGGRSDEAKEYLERVITASGKMGVLLADLLEFSRLGRIKEDKLSFPMKEALFEAMLNLQGMDGFEKDQLEIPEDLGEVFGAPSRIASIWQNLMENAVKYRKPGQIAHMRIAYEDSEKECIYSLTDDGIGIDKKFHQKIFNLFDKLNPSSPGSGAGLAIVKRILEAHGGRVWVESSLGAGCSFYFALPKLKK